MSRRHKGKSERYVKLRFWLLNSPAWQSLPPAARALYIEMVKRYNGYNNGQSSWGSATLKSLLASAKTPLIWLYASLRIEVSLSAPNAALSVTRLAWTRASGG